MVKPGFGIFQARRKSSGNAIEDADIAPAPNASPSTEQGGFRVLNRAEIEKAKLEKQEQTTKKAQKFGRFSSFGTSGNKGRNQSMDEDSPSSSKRDSKSSSGTQSFTSRPYNAGQYGGSSSTLPSSAESDPNDNMFSNLPPRPYSTQHNSSPNSLAMGAVAKQLPPVPDSRPHTTSRYYGHPHDDPVTPSVGAGRNRAMTTSSYASTAIPPKLEADLNFGSSGFDDLFSDLDRKNSPDFAKDTPGRSLLAGRRTIQAEPIRIDSEREIEAPLQSWDSRGSGEHLIASPIEEQPSPPPVPPHKYAKYAPVASHSPELNGSSGFEDVDAKLVRQSVQSQKSQRQTSPKRDTAYTSTPTTSFQTPLSSSSMSNNTTPKAAMRPAISPMSEDDDDNLFAPPKSTPVRKPAAPIPKENIPPPSMRNEPARRVLTAAEYQAQQRLQMSQPLDDSSEGEDYDDEEDAVRKREEEQRAIRHRQQMQIAREHMRRTTTAGTSSEVGPLSNGFPSETSLQADEWSDEEIPLGVLLHHGFPGHNKPPTQPANAAPSYFMSSTPNAPDRPASAGPGPMGDRASAFRPAFARNLPEDPYSSVIGGGLVRQPNRESMGFSRGAASVYNESTSGTVYDPQPQFTSLVDQIQMRDNAKQKYTGGASSKRLTGGPFTGALGGQMNAMNHSNSSTRMSTMGMPGMPGMNPMMNMMGGPMPMMGTNQMQYPMHPQNELMMQQMMQQMFQMQAQQNAMFGQQQLPQDPRMSMAPQQNPAFLSPQFQNNNFLNVGAGLPNQQRPMSVMSAGTNQPNQQGRPYSTPMPQTGFQQRMAMNNGYTPSIAPSERSNIGLSARYRPVQTGNGMQDSQSISSSMTLQASTGATDSNKKVKGILKNKPAPQITVREDEEDDWGKKMAARKSKFANAHGGVKRDDVASSGLHEFVRGVDGY